MDWQIDRNWNWPIAICGEPWIVRKCKSLGKTYDSRTWSRPKSDPTLQMQISMQNASANSNVNAIWSDFYFRFTKICSPLEQETHFWNPTLSNRPSNIHFLEHWRPEIRTHWAIFWTFIALLPVRFVSFPLQSPIIILILARDLCILGIQSPIRKTTTLITLAIL